ncbi:MAG TPA: diacylglycerol kinase family protein [Marmoricola sp.]|nr:diacylglycerol kinase family protein [Marmoricola sp.]
MPRLLGALAGLAIFTALAGLVYWQWALLQTLDDWIGRWPQQLTAGHDGLANFFRTLGLLTDTKSQTVITTVIVIWLLLKKQHRAAIWTAGLMITIGIAIPLLKRLVRRERPTWDDPVTTLSSFSFPSGHAMGIAGLVGVSIVLSVMLVRKRGLRRTLISFAVLVGLLVGADRIFLGVHYLSDVVAGYAFGVAVVLTWLAFLDPLPKTIAEVHDPLPHPNPAVRSGHVGVVLNPIKVEDPEKFKTLVERLAGEAGYQDVKWWHTTVEDTGHGMARAALESGVDVVVAVGGDGTIRAVCEELAGSGVPIGIVPAGTGNLLARNLNLPLYLRSAVDVALSGQDQAIDMVRISGDDLDEGIFLVMAGMGFDAAIMEGVNEEFKDKVGWPAYVWSGLKAMMFPAIWVEISIDGGEFTRHHARTVVIGNVGYLQAGLPLLPNAAIDDGEIDVVLLHPKRFVSWVPIAARILTQSERSDDALMRLRGRSVVVRAEQKVPRQIDGDPMAPGREIRAESVHGVLLVRVPR